MRERIVAACAPLFLEHHHADISLAEIERATQLTRGALYYYFRGKEDIYAAVVLDSLDGFGQAIAYAIDHRSSNPKSALLAVVDVFARHFKEQPLHFGNLQGFFFGDRASTDLDATLLDLANQRARHIVNQIRQVIEHGNRSKAFRCADPEFAVMALWGLMVTTLRMNTDNPRFASVARAPKRLKRSIEHCVLRIVGAHGS